MLSTEVHILLHLYECMTVPVYLRIVFVLLRENKFIGRPFWRIFCFASILDLFYYLLTLLFYRFPLLPIFQPLFARLPPSRWIGWIMFSAFLAIYLQYFLHFLVCLNRFTGICFPFRHEKFWRKTNRFWLSGSFIVALGLTFHRLFTIGQFMPLIASDPTKGYTPIPIQHELYFIRQELITTILGTACALTCLTLNSITLALIIRHKGNQSRHQPANNNDGGSRRLEIGLFLITLWTMFIQFVFNTFELLIYWILGAFLPMDYFVQNKDAYFYVLFSQIPWIIDIYTLSQPWAALLLSFDLREATFPALFRRKQTAVGIAHSYSTPVIPLK